MTGDKPVLAAFADTTEPSRLWREGPHGVTIGALREAIIRGERLILLVGAAGVGKTILVNALAQDLAADGVTVARLAFPVTDAADLVFAIGLALRLRDKPGTREELARAVSGKYVAVVIDDAHAIGDAALAELTALLEGHPGFAAILVGNETLVPRLDVPLATLSSSVHVLRPLDGDESARFIAHNAASARGPALAPDLVRLIASTADGTPRVIVWLCRKVLDSDEIPDADQLHRWLDEIAATDADVQAIVARHATRDLRPRSMWRGRALMTGALAAAVTMATLVAWHIIRPAPSAMTTAPHTVGEEIAVDTPKPSGAVTPPPKAPRPERPVVMPTAPAVSTPKESVVSTPKAPVAPRAQSGPAPAPQRAEPTRERANAAAASPATDARTPTSDPGAVIDWLLKQPPRASD